MNESCNMTENLSVLRKMILCPTPLIIYGPARCGKTYNLMNILEADGINTKTLPETVAFSKKNDKSTCDYWIVLRRTIHHTEIDINDIFCNDSILIKELILFLLNQISFEDKKHLIILRHFDNISKEAQFMLRRLIETSDNCKFIFIVQNISKIINSLNSRCMYFKFKGNDIEKQQLGNNYTRWEDDVETFCKNPTTAGIYSMLMNLIDPSDIFKEMLNILVKKFPDRAHEITNIIATCEHSCVIGTKPVIHIEHCVNLLREQNIFSN